ncbi:carbohydrate ABC transporter membrane protein 1 (CUT1 family) [Anaerobacterium chartisolvens]|uniref:Carbohydrate ABC transporter membrane protein 1 (CUT1 family) n=1 Tax=Anaerobacterium chartisolvens TaxID=1297424 RepID=A0A369BAH9_9FIRM|nr:sugar ABC transporter permease [Anaerobacterium chartisolvens]RCX17527.1 carbohydrate ABC transporter membrane protein 1 (CUT1 family) [Anaerobacterium chartisolvens]
MFTFKQNKLIVIAFLIPALLFYISFMLYPAFYAIVLSFFKWSGVASTDTYFNGLNNYILLFRNPVFWLSVKNLVFLLVVSVLTQLPIAFILAYMLSGNIRYVNIFKVSYFMPVILSATAVSMMWKLILDDKYGLLNNFLRGVGLESLSRSWLTDPDISFKVITLINSWQHVGYFLIILIAGIATISEELFEALKIDGAGIFTTVFKVVIPLIKEVIGVCVVLILTQCMKTFDIIYVMTSGTFGPNNVNQVPVGLMYYRSFIEDNFGQGSAIATMVLLFGVLLSSVVYIKGFQQKNTV